MNTNLRVSGLTVLALALPFVTASSVLASPAPKNENLDVLGTAESNDPISSGLTAEANAAEQNESGNLLSVTWSIENTGNEQVLFNWPAGTTYMYQDANSHSGITVTSVDENIRYHPLMDSEGNCLCSGNISLDSKSKIDPGEKVAYWSMFSLPTEVQEINLEIPGFDVIEGVPVS